MKKPSIFFLLLFVINTAIAQKKLVLTLNRTNITLTCDNVLLNKNSKCDLSGDAQIDIINNSGQSDNITITVAPQSDNSKIDKVPFDMGLIPDTGQTASTKIIKSVLLNMSSPITLGSKISIVAAYGEKAFGIENIETSLPLLNTAAPKESDKTVVQISKIAYWDALLLDSIARTNEDLNIALTILSHYSGKKLDANSLTTAFNDNEYLQKYIESHKIQTWKPNSLSRAQSTGNTGKMLTSLASSGIGGLDVTNIADGFAKFLVKRTKQELNIAFFERFKQELDKPAYQDLRTVFPLTYRALNAIGDQIYNYEAYIQTLRECFEKDLANIITTLPLVIDNHEDFFSKQPVLKATIYSAFYIGQGLQEQRHPGDIIAQYPEEYLTGIGNEDIKASIQTLKILSSSLRAKNTVNGYWIAAKDVAVLGNNNEVFKLYIGLVLEQIKRQDIKLGNASLATTINKSYPDINALESYKNYFRNFVRKAETVDKKLRVLSQQKGDSISLENYYSFFGATIDLLKYAVAVEQLPGVPRTYLKEKTAIYFDAAQASADLIIDVNRRNYASAIVNAYYLYTIAFNADVVSKRVADLQVSSDKVVPLNRKKEEKFNLEEKRRSASWRCRIRKIDRKIAKLQKQIDSLDKSLTAVEIAASEEYSSLVDIEKVKADLYKYGTFMATIVQAKSSDEVAQAIEAFALPTGSARIKRETPFNVAVNAYVGPFIGHESNIGIDESDSWVNSYGVTAPIGISISRGHSVAFLGTGKQGWKESKYGWSTSLFLSVIDLGAITAFRFQDETVETAPDIQLQDIISPGAFISIGIPKTPLSFNFGVQAGPRLRNLTSDAQNNQVTADRAGNSYYRISASFVVDIPVINFYSKSKK